MGMINMKRFIVVLFVALMFFTTAVSTAGAADHPNGWTHRPVLEHFTGLSCPPCMNGAHPDSAKLWQEEGYSEGYPWNYVEFHELNGGGEDDLMTDESRERMRYYQPGVAGTPSLEADGGYVQLGGSHGSTADASYDDMKQAMIDSGERDSMKKIDLKVTSMYNGVEFVISVDIEYIQNDEAWFPTPEDPLPDDTLNGQLQVFMVEDNVVAWSTYKEEFVTNHNVFREYAIQDYELPAMQPGDTYNHIAAWTVPDTIVKDGTEIPIPVPINPLNVWPIAVVYDLDDTSSGRGDGSENNDGGDGDGTYRALNSATPHATAYDIDGTPPEIEEIVIKNGKNGLEVEAAFIDDDNITSAVILYGKPSGPNGTNVTWRAAEFKLEDCVGDTCDVKAGGIGKAELDIDPDQKFVFRILAFDGNWTKAMTEQYHSTDFIKAGGSGGGDAPGFEVTTLLMSVTLLSMVLFFRRRR